MSANKNNKTRVGRNVVEVTAKLVEGSDPQQEQRAIDDATARTLTRPGVQAAALIQRFEGENHEVNALIRELESQIALVRGGDMSRPEAMLLAQAQALDEVFYALVRRSQANMGSGYLNAAETYMRLALKAQSQSRTTLETLAEIKNPRPVAFVRQANIAHGHQQVNNGTLAGDGLARGNSEKQSNELSRETHELLQDARASQAKGRADTQMEAMAQIHRTSHDAGQGEKCEQ